MKKENQKIYLITDKKDEYNGIDHSCLLRGWQQSIILKALHALEKRFNRGSLCFLRPGAALSDSDLDNTIYLKKFYDRCESIIEEDNMYYALAFSSTTHPNRRKLYIRFISENAKIDIQKNTSKCIYLKLRDDYSLNDVLFSDKKIMECEECIFVNIK